MDDEVQKLLRNNPNLWRAGDTVNSGVRGIPTGFKPLDAALPGGGWPVGALMEIITPQWGIGELQLLAPLMATFNRQQRWLVWIAPPYIPYPPALQELGMDISRIIILTLEQTNNDVVWSMEKILRAEQCGMVLAWPQRIAHTVMRRLQLAAESGCSLGVLFRRKFVKTSPAALRLQLTSINNHLQIDIVKARGGSATRRVTIDLSAL